MRKKILIVSSFLVIFVSALFSSGPVASSCSQCIEDELKEFLRDNYPWSEIEMNGFAVSGELPDQHLKAIKVEKGPPGKTIFILEFENDRKIAATAVIKAYDQIFVSRRAFKKGYYLQKDDIYPIRMDVKKIPNGALKDIEKFIGKPLLRSITANMPLISGMVSEAPVVKKGQRVILLVESKGLKMSIIGEMKQDGTVGNHAKAINLASKKIVTGILINENTVKMEL